MDTVKATVRSGEDKYFLDIEFPGETVSIPLSEDNPNKVKSAFNRLIERVRVGEFEIVLQEVGGDLFSQVANEYIAQLNREVSEIRAEMKKFNLLVEAPTEPG